MKPIKNLSLADVITIAIAWAGAAAVVFTMNPVDAVVAIVAIASAYYLAKWVVLCEKPISVGDIAAIFLFWVAAATLNYLVHDGVVGIVCIAAAYYLSKWVIRKQTEGPTK